MPRGSKTIKVVVWGSGGAGGCKIQNNASGDRVYFCGGGGSCVTSIIDAFEKEMMWATVGAGGTVSQNNESCVYDTGGQPSGGSGGVDSSFASSGGGGGCSYLSRLGLVGYQVLILAAGGGGAGTMHALGADQTETQAPETRETSGKTASFTQGGAGGENGGNCGKLYQGASSATGGGGGGGYYGGGSGGARKGEFGSGGGGSSFGNEIKPGYYSTPGSSFEYGEKTPGQGGNGTDGFSGAIVVEFL